MNISANGTSAVICEYLENVFPEPSLVPSEPLAQAQTRTIARMTDLYIAPHNTPLSRMRMTKTHDQEIVDKQAAEFAKGFALIGQYMGPGPFAVAATPTLGDCALAPFIGLLKRSVFPNYAEVKDPTEGDGRLAEWWHALEEHPACNRNIVAYDEALETFLKWLYEQFAKRNG